MARRIAALLFALAALPAVPSRAETVPPEARAIIERQLDAFSRGDATAAYALAAPLIKRIFPDAETFMAMVRSQYPAIYRRRTIEFGRTVASDDTIAQAVTITDVDNQVWTAFYQLARQPDGTWLVNGCTVVRSEETSL